MSSRQLRKLQKQEELEKAKLTEHQEEVEVEESEDELILPTKPKASLFANLAALEDEEDEAQVADEEEDEVVEESNQVQAPRSTSKKSKKSKKKKGKKGKEKPLDVNDKADDSEDIDAVLRDLSLKHSARPASKQTTKLPVDPEYERICALLSVGSQHLKVANEMRDIYGKDFSTTTPTENNAQGARGARRQNRGQPQEVDIETALKGRHLPGKGLTATTFRRNALIEGKQHWPNSTTGGLGMEIVDDKTDDETVEFRFTHNEGYQSCQAIFYALVDQGEPQNLIGFLIKNPYHISTLLAVSRITKAQGDHSLSSELLERALFSFGRAATSSFNIKLSKGQARLDFARPENREFWLAGYHYIKSLIQKGTYRTAFEWAKLLLSLDPEGDPYKMQLMLHELALRAGENKWLIEVANESGFEAMWQPEEGGVSNVGRQSMVSSVLAAVNLKDGVMSRDLLTRYMKKYPWIFVRLFSEFDLTAPPSIWGTMPRTSAETLLTELYVLQTKDMWGTAEATALLMEVAHTISNVNADAIEKLGDENIGLNLVRFVYLEGNQSLMALAPSHILHQDSTDWDPYPPELNIFSYESQRNALDRVQGRHRGRVGMDDTYDPIAAMLRLLPGRRDTPVPRESDSDTSDDMPELGADDENPTNASFTTPRGLISRALALMGWSPEGGSTGPPGSSEDHEDVSPEDTISANAERSVEGQENNGGPGHVPTP